MLSRCCHAHLLSKTLRRHLSTTTRLLPPRPKKHWLWPIFGTTTLVATTSLVGATVFFSPSYPSMVARRQKLLGLNSDDRPSWYVERINVLKDITGLWRFGKAASAVGIVAFDYWRLKRYRLQQQQQQQQTQAGTTDATYVEFKHTVQQRSADRIYRLCRELGGVYTKLGQYVATLNHVLPTVWTDALVHLQDSAASVPLDGALAQMIENELGAPLSEIFSEFDPTPIAAASLAQVHRARVKDSGLQVAVKVQYPHLASQVVGDLWAMEVLSSAVGYFFDDFHYGWLLPEFEETADMELDFKQEQRNSERIKAMFTHRTDVHVPYVIDALSTRKVLTMEFVSGFRVDDVDAMVHHGLAPLEVATTITSVFGEMIHVHGFVHCDPHPGNLMVQTHATNKQGHRLVLLDHGMYRRLEPSFRHSYCQLWKALLTQDLSLGTSTARQLGIGTLGFETLSLALTFRTPTSTSRMGGRMSKEEKTKLKHKFRKISAGDINRFMESLPRDMLFVLRTTDIVRSLNKKLGGTARARFVSMGEFAIAGLLVPNTTLSQSTMKTEQHGRRLNLNVDSEMCRTQSTFTRFQSWYQLWYLRARLWLLDVVLFSFLQPATTSKERTKT